jgi:glycosyltransferase involved in cell wall biosynthesis
MVPNRDGPVGRDKVEGGDQQLNILFTSAIPYLPQLIGGLQTNTHELALELIGRGHRPAVLTRLSYGNAFGARTAAMMRLTGRTVSSDTQCGYPIFRAREPSTVLGEIPRPDVAVMQDGGHMLRFAGAFDRLGIPAISYFHGLDFEDWMIDGRPTTGADLPTIDYYANSHFTAKRFCDRYKLSATVIPPVFRPERYRVDRIGLSVTFINPVAEKGVDVALEVAAQCPDIPFVFVKAWPLSLSERLRLRRRLRCLPNVAIREPAADMRSIYQECRVLLVPSKWKRETWGRVASEAQFSGIPVIGSDIGGLPEAIGPGGVIVGAEESATVWVAALKRLWYDEDWYREKSRAALAHSQRPQLDIKAQVSMLEDGLLRARNKHPDTGPRFACKSIG